MAKPTDYDSLTDFEKWRLCLVLLRSERGQYLLDRAFELAGAEAQAGRRRVLEDPASDAAVFFKMAVACQALEAAIDALTARPDTDGSDVEDMQIIYNGLRIQTRVGRAGDGKDQK